MGKYLVRNIAFGAGAIFAATLVIAGRAAAEPAAVSDGGVARAVMPQQQLPTPDPCPPGSIRDPEQLNKLPPGGDPGKVPCVKQGTGSAIELSPAARRAITRPSVVPPTPLNLPAKPRP